MCRFVCTMFRYCTRIFSGQPMRRTRPLSSSLLFRCRNACASDDYNLNDNMDREHVCHSCVRQSFQCGLVREFVGLTAIHHCVNLGNKCSREWISRGNMMVGRIHTFKKPGHNWAHCFHAEDLNQSPVPDRNLLCVENRCCNGYIKD